MTTDDKKDQTRDQDAVWDQAERLEDRTELDALTVDVDGFEGPLDLLLALARTQKVDHASISVLALALSHWR